MLNIYTICGAGVGSSLMLKIFTQQILTEEGIQAKVESSDIGSVNPNAADIIITTSDFAKVLRNADTPIIKIDNLTDKVYLKQELIKTIDALNNK